MLAKGERRQMKLYHATCDRENGGEGSSDMRDEQRGRREGDADGGERNELVTKPKRKRCTTEFERQKRTTSSANIVHIPRDRSQVEPD